MCDTPDPMPDFSASGPVEYRPAKAAPGQAIEEILASEEARLLSVPGTVSVGIGLGPAGGQAIMVGVVDAGVAADLPSEIGGVPLIVTVTGEVDAQPHR